MKLTAKLSKLVASIDITTALVILLVAAFAYYIYLSFNNFDVKPYNYAEGFAGPAADAELYFVYATWCPHCKGVLPAMKELAAKSPVDIDGKKVAVVLVESEEKEKIASLPMKIEGFPTFFLKKADGTVREYNGEREAAALLDFVKESL
jgi:thiol-disulfide isomerase/thioredoxin